MALRPNRKNSKVRYIAPKFETCIDWSLNEMERKKLNSCRSCSRDAKKKGEGMGQ